MAKKDRLSRNIDIDLYNRLDEYSDIEDTRYWGLFRKNEGINIDPKRMASKIYGFLTPEMIDYMNTRNTHYFTPEKYDYFDYNCNLFYTLINDLKKKWATEYKPLINEVISKIVAKKYTPYYDDKMMSGISGPGAASSRATFKNILAEQEALNKKYEVISSMYSQFYHLMVSQIEAITVNVLHKNNAIKDTFNRNVFYGTCTGKAKRFDEIEGFSDYDKLYCLWHFIKHNSESTYKSLKERYPEVLREGDYKQGQLAIYYVKFDDDLIESSLDNNLIFFMNYCSLVFGEDYKIAQWNYEMYFIRRVNNEIEDLTNPLGLDVFDEMD